MAVLNRHRTVWSGFVGGPGVTTLYWSDVTGPNLTAWNTHLTAIAARYPSVITWTSQNTGDRIDDATGAIVGAWTVGAVAPVVATGTGGYFAPAGNVINWRTAGIVNGKRVRGRTFMVPLNGSSQDTDGSIATASISTLRTALASFVTAAAADLRVWHRPVDGSGGSSHVVTAADIPDKACVLRSRRD